MTIEPKAKIKKMVVKVDYSQTLSKMIDNGKYDYVHEFFQLTRAGKPIFSIRGKGIIQIEFITLQFERPITTEKIMDYMEKNNMRPAKLEELLAACAQHPIPATNLTAICTLGTVATPPKGPSKGMSHYPYVDRVKSIAGVQRNLLVDFYDPAHVYQKTTQFAAVTK